MEKATSFKLQATKRRGQVLLIAVMLLATVITVVMTIAFNTTTNTQVSRLEADSQKALAAAEAGVEAVIKESLSNNSNESTSIGDLGSFRSQGISGTAQIVTGVKPYFVTPLLQKDEQYTFYLSDYSNISSTPSFTNPWTGSIDLFLASEGGCPSIEVTIIKRDYSLDRYAYNTCDTTIINASSMQSSSSPTVIDGVSFSYKTGSTAPIPVTEGLVMFVKILNAKTKLGVKGFDAEGNEKILPLQGKTVESEARTSSGVVKKVQLFQSYPQIPSSFFMTSF